MKLTETLRKYKIYLLQERMTVKELAKKLDVVPNHLYLIFSGKKKTSRGLAEKIEELTKGAIKVTDLHIGDNRYKHCPRCPTCGAKLKTPPKSQ